MKIVQINTTCGVGSTGKICIGISELLTENHIENYIFYSSKSNGYPLGIQCSDDRYIKIQALKSKLLGNYGFNSKRSTIRMIEELERIKPDIVHLHNIHGHDCDIEALFLYFKNKKIKLIWTFHDCWAFTGYCTHFFMAKCYRWKDECKKCVKKKAYSCFFDKSRELFKRKKELFSGLDLKIVTPSQWLADIVKESFLKEYPVMVIHNGIDLSVFKPTKSNFRGKHHIEDKKIVLGVASGWGKGKGIDVFCELEKRLSNDYKIVLVGTDRRSDKLLTDNVISIRRTQNQAELAELYSTADIFVNPTREDCFPTVNLESLACGTPVLTFRTGGSPEMIDKSCGSVVACDDLEMLAREIKRICEEMPYTREACVKKAGSYDKVIRFMEYLELYERT